MQKQSCCTVTLDTTMLSLQSSLCKKTEWKPLLEKSNAGLNGPLCTNSDLMRSDKTRGQSAGSFGGAATVPLGSELLLSDAGCTSLAVLVLAEAACVSPGSV